MTSMFCIGNFIIPRTLFLPFFTSHSAFTFIVQEPSNAYGQHGRGYQDWWHPQAPRAIGAVISRNMFIDCLLECGGPSNEPLAHYCIRNTSSKWLQTKDDRCKPWISRWPRCVPSTSPETKDWIDCGQDNGTGILPSCDWILQFLSLTPDILKLHRRNDSHQQEELVGD